MTLKKTENLIRYSIQEIRKFVCRIFEKTIKISNETFQQSSLWRRKHQYFSQLAHRKKKLSLIRNCSAKIFVRLFQNSAYKQNQKREALSVLF
jgi:hypothetical protein